MNRLLLLVFLLLPLWNCGPDYEQGKRLYQYYCANCHMENGQGLRKLIPPIAASDYYINHIDEIPCIIRYGLSDTIVVNGVTFQEAMEGHPSLSPAEITNIINYMHSEWYPDLPYTTLDVVEEQLDNCPGQK